MDDTLIRPARPPRTTSRGALATGGALVLFLSLVALASPALTSPERVTELTIVNRSAWLVRVEARVDGSWVAIGLAPPESRTVVTDVLDAGSRWALRFGVADGAVDTTVERSRLAGADWQLDVPDAVADVADSVGAGPAPPTS